MSLPVAASSAGATGVTGGTGCPAWASSFQSPVVELTNRLPEGSATTSNVYEALTTAAKATGVFTVTDWSKRVPVATGYTNTADCGLSIAF